MKHSSSQPDVRLPDNDRSQNDLGTTSRLPSEEQDNMALARLGYKSEFTREFGNWSTISFAFSIMGLCSSVTTTFNAPMLSGGPASVVWCWLIGSVMCFTLGTSIAELVSAYPTSGGLYSASAYLVPRRYRAFVGFSIGWLNILGQVAGVASTEFGLSQMLWAAYSLYGAGGDPDFIASKAQVVGLFIGLLVLHGIFNSLATKSLAQITKSFIFFNLAGTLAIILGLLINTPDKHSASYIFTKVVNQTGWKSDGLAFLLGLLSVQWTMTDYDATAHITEEVKRASIAAPVAIFVAVAVGFGIVWSIICVTAFSVVLTALQATSRTVFSFSRDGGLPDDGLFARLSSNKVPVYAVWVVIICSILMGLLDFVSVVALNAIFSLCTMALDTSYAIPIALKMVFMDHPEVNFKPGPFNLGRGPLMWLCNGISVAWVSFVVVILALPTVRPVTAVNMNYASVITMGVVICSSIWYFCQARRWYQGPKSNLVPSPLPSHESELSRDEPAGPVSDEENLKGVLAFN
ncbi:amino acid permease-domain-containing protein [Melampsora americana]|nr:amino acid permease-domain-containing protein [Melampsora americana]